MTVLYSFYIQNMFEEYIDDMFFEIDKKEHKKSIGYFILNSQKEMKLPYYPQMNIKLQNNRKQVALANSIYLFRKNDSLE